MQGTERLREQPRGNSPDATLLLPDPADTSAAASPATLVSTVLQYFSARKGRMASGRPSISLSAVKNTGHAGAVGIGVVGGLECQQGSVGCDWSRFPSHMREQRAGRQGGYTLL